MFLIKHFRKSKGEPDLNELVKKVKKEKKPFSVRTAIENFLSIVLFFIAIYLIVTPFLPEIELWITKATDKNQGFVYQTSHPQAPKDVTNSEIAKEEHVDITVKPIPKENRLVIPSINVDILITEGPDARSLHDGGWRRPKTSTPDNGGNTVIAAHRFTYNVNYPSYFYNLDKVKDNDPIIIYWKGKEYDYSVREIKVVTADRVEIEDNTDAPQLTLYTCTPLWTAKDRLVLVAKPV